jgi:hypothetical protein
MTETLYMTRRNRYSAAGTLEVAAGTRDVAVGTLDVTAGTLYTARVSIYLVAGPSGKKTGFHETHAMLVPFHDYQRYIVVCRSGAGE